MVVVVVIRGMVMVMLLRVVRNIAKVLVIAGTKDTKGLPRWPSSKESTCNAENKGGPVGYLVGKIPWSRAWQSIPIFLPEEAHGQRSLAGNIHSFQFSHSVVSDSLCPLHSTRGLLVHYKLPESTQTHVH